MEDVAVLSSSAARHSCKVCGKGFPCGRSLGGHMRSHSLAEVAAAAAGNDDSDDGEHHGRRWMQSGARGSNGVVHGAGGGGYGLRENPKKTRRLSGSASDDDGAGGDDEEEEGGGDACHDDRGELLSSVFGHVRRHALGGGEDISAEEEEGVSIPSEAAVVMAAAVPAPRRRRRSMRVPAPAPTPAAARDAFDKEPVEEDVAHCLIMLSREYTTGKWAAEFSQEKRRTERQGGLARNGYRHDDVDDSDDDSGLPQHAGVEFTGSQKRKTPVAKRAQYECPGCGRAFQSYQALGGHRASHKRINSDCCIAKAAPDQPKPIVETNASSSTPSTPVSPDVDAADIADREAAAAAMKAKKVTKFECPICLKVFGSGQALGGHKRSHSIAGELYEHGDAVIAADKEPPLIPARFLNLNLPAPGADD